MEFTKDTLLKDILKEYPWLKDVLIEMKPAAKPLFGPLGKPFMKKATIEDLASKTGRTPERLIRRLTKVIAEHEAEED